MFKDSAIIYTRALWLPCLVLKTDRRGISRSSSGGWNGCSHPRIGYDYARAFNSTIRKSYLFRESPFWFKQGAYDLSKALVLHILSTAFVGVAFVISILPKKHSQSRIKP